MELTRRDAVAALAAAGVAAGAGGVALLSRDDGGPGSSADGEFDEGPLGEQEVATLVAAAAVLYPSEVDGVGSFVREYAAGRAADDPDHAAGMAEAAAYLDEYARAWHDEPFDALDEPTREEALRGMRADTADPVPDGSDVERVRYYVVNELQFALYSSPTGAELVGLENPQGHPGGTDSYQRGPGA